MLLYIAALSCVALCLLVACTVFIRKHLRKDALKQNRLSDAFQRSKAEHRHGDAGMSVNILVAGLTPPGAAH